MRTKTYYWPSEKDPEVEMEVCRDGSIYSSLAYCPALHGWLDCTKDIRERNVWTDRAAQFAADADWNDDGDFSFEQFKDSVAQIIGVRPA